MGFQRVVGIAELGKSERVGHNSVSGRVRFSSVYNSTDEVPPWGGTDIDSNRVGRSVETKDDGQSGTPNKASGPRRILHVDCDAFFVQVARLEDPEGVGRIPLLMVGGSSKRGVITSVSYAVRAFGARSGMPTGKALRLCPDATVVPVPRGAVAVRSKEVRDALRDLCPVVQAGSVDEFYLDLTGTERLFKHESVGDTARRIRMAVLDRTKISVSIGVATCRLVAKLATNLAKPAGVHVVAPGSEEEFMKRFELRQIPGIGPAFAASLKEKGLSTVKDGLAVEREWLERWYGESRALWLHERIRGRDGSRVNPYEGRKSISSERTFYIDVDDDHELGRKILKLAGSVGKVLRKSELRARTITVKLRDSDFRTRQASRTVTDGIESDGAIYRTSRELLAELRRRRRRPARLLGVGLSNFEEREEIAEQLGFFRPIPGSETVRERRISKTVDALNERFGEGTIVPAAVVRRDRGS